MFERLDRVVVTVIWLDIFLLIKVFYFDRDKSDYVFIKIIEYSGQGKKLNAG